MPFPPHYDPLEAADHRRLLRPLVPEDVPAAAGLAARARCAATRTMPKARCSRSCQLVFCDGAVPAARRRRACRRPRGRWRSAAGSCRDMATLMMEAARLSGVAARFASGYLHGTRRWPATPRPTPGPRSICRRSAGAASIRRSATSCPPATSSPASAATRAA